MLSSKTKWLKNLWMPRIVTTGNVFMQVKFQ